MSLCIALSTPRGLILSGDRRIMAKTETGTEYVLTDHEQKLFLTENRRGYLFCGAASYQSGTLAPVFGDILRAVGRRGLPMAEELSAVKETLLETMPDVGNVIILSAGYENGRRYMLDTNTTSQPVTGADAPDPVNMKYAGESGALSSMLHAFRADYGKFPLQESADYLRFLNRATADLLHFSENSDTVSPGCDVLVITPDRARFLSRDRLR